MVGIGKAVPLWHGYDWHNLCHTHENLSIPLKADFANEMTCYS